MTNGTVFTSVFDAIADTQGEALNLKLRARLMTQVVTEIEAQGWTQAETARRLGLTQPRVSDLCRGKLSRFSLDALVNLLAALGKDVELRVA